jgi:FkbM family methyltransferase
MGGDVLRLVFDVGMNNGDDTAYYLFQGYEVIAVEAAPGLVHVAEVRFRDEIRSGQLTILNVAIADRAGEQDFWICVDEPEWNSLNRSVAQRNCSTHYRIKVASVCFREILAKYNKPYYIKIDIEGSDSLCLRDMDEANQPIFISAESECGGDSIALDEKEYLATIHLMRDRGYSRFKLVNQNDLIPVTRSTLQCALTDPEYRCRVRAEIARRTRWFFPSGSSGPFGNDIPGNWMDFSEAVDVYCLCREQYFRMFNDAPVYSFWFDWHATKESASSMN